MPDKAPSSIYMHTLTCTHTRTHSLSGLVEGDDSDISPAWEDLEEAVLGSSLLQGPIRVRADMMLLAWSREQGIV